jgi:hypothetical protein
VLDQTPNYFVLMLPSADQAANLGYARVRANELQQPDSEWTDSWLLGKNQRRHGQELPTLTPNGVKKE